MPEFVSTSRLLDENAPKTLADARKIIDRARRDPELRRTYAFHDGRDQDWRQEVLYFLLPDRFNDGKDRPAADRATVRRLRQAGEPSMVRWEEWAASGKRWQGGTIAGITARIPYLVELGVTALWIAPLFRQRERSDTHHGYAIQNFLDIDPRFGTRADLVALVEAAHTAKLRVILDIIVNHTGHNWDYFDAATGNACTCPWYKQWPNHYGNPHDPPMSTWEIRWKNGYEQPHLNAAGPFCEFDAVYPEEFRDPAFYSCAGGDCTASDACRETLFSNHEQHHRGDFPGTFRDVATDKAHVIGQLADVFKYWIALANPDGFRIDTLKHMGIEESRNFCGALKAFAAEIGKAHFFLLGEIAGADIVRDAFLDVAFGQDQRLSEVPLVALSRRNLDAALDIGGNLPLLGEIGRGEKPVSDYIGTFKWRGQEFSGHRYEGNRHVSVLNDHDHIMAKKIRFSSFVNDDAAAKDHLVAVPTAIQLFTLGIPCIYYGSEQAFAGPAQKELPYVQGHSWGGGDWADRYLREAMFGPKHPRAAHGKDLKTQVGSVDAACVGFGPFGTFDRHFFDTGSPSFVRIAALCRLRHEQPVLRLGDMYARRVQARIPGSSDADHLGYGHHAQGHLQAWSRILGWTEAVIVVNPNAYHGRSGDIEVGWELCPPGSRLRVLLNTAEEWVKHGGEAFGGLAAGTLCTVHGELNDRNPPHLWIDDLPPGEVLVLVKE